jgi:4'-phosphopantetheinyl transferase
MSVSIELPSWPVLSAGDLVPSPDVVAVVACRLDVQPVEVEALRRLLAPDEVERALRFRTDQLHDAFVVGRGRLRQILGRAMGVAPGALHLGVGPGGKPCLHDPAGERLRFNVAHSRGLMLSAVTIDHPVGVDVEYVSLETDWEPLATRFFAPAEQRAIAALSRDAQRGAFFDCWTRKEAVLKATGDGLARPLDSFVVSVLPRDAAVLACDPALGRPDSWLLAPLPVGTSYRGTVALRDSGEGIAVRLWSWGRG